MLRRERRTWRSAEQLLSIHIRRYNEANAAKVFIANLSLSEVPYPFLSQAVQSAEEAIYSLQPFTNASAALRHAFEVAEAVKLLEITLSYSYNKEVVRIDVD